MEMMLDEHGHQILSLPERIRKLFTYTVTPATDLTVQFQITNMKNNNSRSILHICTSSTSLLFLIPLLQASFAESQPTKPGSPTLPSHHEPNRRFTPSIAIIIVILIGAFLLMAFFSVYLRHCAGDIRGRRSSLRRSSTRARARRQSRGGLDPAVIETFPTFEYSAVKQRKLGSDALECAVCLNEFEDDETLRLLPKCNHVFHPDCIDGWLVSHTTCPVCRSDLVTLESDTKGRPPADTTDPGNVPEDETRDEVPLRQIVVDASDDPNQDLEEGVVNPNLNQSRPIRSKSTRQPLRFPRSHTTGHSLVLPGENLERFTLRLPEHVRKEIVDGELDRSASYAGFRTEGPSVSGEMADNIGGEGGEESGRGRFQWRFDRAAKSDRWAFLTGPSFFSRTVSVRSQK